VRAAFGLSSHQVQRPIDTFDVAGMVTGGDFLGTVVHEIGHVLGIGTLWSSRGLLTGAGTRPALHRRAATRAYNEIFSHNDSGVPVEAGYGGGPRFPTGGSPN